MDRTAETELTALEKHPCPACGAQAEWNPSKQKLICPFCGTEAPYEFETETGKIKEIDLVRTLRELPDELRGWQEEKKTVRCQSCQAVSVFDPQRVGQNCEFCGSPELVDYEEIKAPIRPQSLLPFKVSESTVRETIRDWYRNRWFAPTALGRRAATDTVRGVYIPYWTFDAAIYCPWRAEAGHYYYTGAVGGKRSRQVRWEPVRGVVEDFFDDVPVPATRGVQLSLLKAVEPFPTGDLVPYDTGFLSGFVVEHYQVVLIDAVKLARQAMREKLRKICASQIPGDTYRNLEIMPSYSGETFKHILVPVWLLTYFYGHRTFQVVVNGYTGKIAGRYPKSLWKILALVAVVLLILGLLVAFEIWDF